MKYAVTVIVVGKRKREFVVISTRQLLSPRVVIDVPAPSRH